MSWMFGSKAKEEKAVRTVSTYSMDSGSATGSSTLSTDVQVEMTRPSSPGKEDPKVYKL